MSTFFMVLAAFVIGGSLGALFMAAVALDRKDDDPTEYGGRPL